MKLPGLGLCTLAFAFVGPVRAADPAPTLDALKAAWHARQDGHKSFRIEWTETMKLKAGDLDAIYTPEFGDGPHPPKDVELTTAYGLAADGVKIAGSEEGQRYLVSEKPWTPFMRAGFFDGRTALELNPLFQPGWGQVTIRSGNDRLDAELDSWENGPVLRLYRPLGGGAFAPLDFKTVKLTGRTETIRGARCAEVVIESNANAPFSVWCDPARGYLPLRETGGGQGVEYELEYRRDDQKRWVPAGWERKKVTADGSVLYRTKSEVKKLDLTPEFGVSAFTPQVPLSSWVTVYKNGAWTEEYLLRADG